MSIEFRNVTKRYGTDKKAPLVVKGISFEVPTGTLTTILGPSGCGKTTSSHRPRARSSWAGATSPRSARPSAT
jgi:ABC-type dipeptide/oligopeptide/nickel transport system ATPase subunit